MSKYNRQYGTRRRLTRRLLTVFAVLCLLTIAGAVVVRHWYHHNLQPVSASQTKVTETIMTGQSVDSIAAQLKQDDLIRSAQAFQWYVNTHNIREKLQAGTYRFAPNMSTPTIAQMIANGKVATDLVTILPGKNLNEIRDALIDAGFKSPAVAQALRADQYRDDYQALADNPKTASLEGFLYPDSYQKTTMTNPSEIVADSLQEMQKHLTSDIRAGFAKQGLTVYQGVTLASIVLKEEGNPAAQRQVAQVFLSRLDKGMRLESDAARDFAQLVHDDRYNSYRHKGLPPGPISNVTQSSLEAVANPAKTDWLYFVNGDNGKTYFSKTLQQHQENIDKHCHKNCPSR